MWASTTDLWRLLCGAAVPSLWAALASEELLSGLLVSCCACCELPVVVVACLRSISLAQVMALSHYAMM